MPHRRRERGFTLLEVLVAFVIAAVALAALTQAAGIGLGSSQVAEQTEQAVSRARSRMSAVTLHPIPGEQSGDDGGGFAWRTLIRPEQASGVTGGPTRPVLYDIIVDVSWTSGSGRRHVTLETERLDVTAEPP